MIKEHDISQEQDDSYHSDHPGARTAQRTMLFLKFCLITVCLTAIIFWVIKSYLPSASKSTSGAEQAFIDTGASKRKAADLLKKEMLEIADRLVGEFPDNENLRVLAVEIQQVCLNYTRARALLEEGIRLNPGYGEFYQRLARIAARDGKHGEVVKCWQKALEISPERPDLNINIAEGFMSSGEYREAIEILEKYIEISPKSGLSYYLLGQSYLQLREYDESKKYFEKAIEIIPDHPQANYGLATVYIRLKQRDKAREHMEIHNKWRQSRADSRKAYSGSDISGVISDSLGEEFTFFSKHLRKLYLNGSSLYRVGQNLKESEELLKKGEKIFKRAIQIAPDQPDLYRELSYIYTVTGRDPARAIEFAEKAVELKESAENYYILFGAYNRNFDPGKALKALDKAIELDPDNSEYRRAYDIITKGKR